MYNSNISNKIIQNLPFKNYQIVNHKFDINSYYDYHIKDQYNKDIFINIKLKNITYTSFKGILFLYTKILNSKYNQSFTLLFIAPKIDSNVIDLTRTMPISFLTFDELHISPSLLCNGYFEVDNNFKLTPKESQLILQLHNNKHKTVQVKDVKQYLQCSNTYAYVLLHNLQKKKWIQRIKKGLYQFIPLNYGYPNRIPPSDPFLLIPKLIKNALYYCTYYTANRYYGFTTQVPFTIFIATQRPVPMLEWNTATYKFITLSPHKFFGYTTKTIFDTKIFIADPEKAIIDSFDKPKYVGGIEELTRIVWQSFVTIDHNKLIQYAKRMKSGALVQRLGFVIDFLISENLISPINNKIITKLQKYKGNTPIYLDTTKNHNGKYNNKWHIVNNMTKNQLLSEIDIK